MPKNLISMEVPAETLTKLQEKLKELRELLAPYLVTLTLEDRKSLPKMSDKTLAFVSKTAEYVKSNPKLIPPMMEAEELGKDFTLNQSLQPVYNSLKQLVDNLSDTLMLSGHEAYAQASLYYASVKMAANSATKMPNPFRKIWANGSHYKANAPKALPQPLMSLHPLRRQLTDVSYKLSLVSL